MEQEKLDTDTQNKQIMLSFELLKGESKLSNIFKISIFDYGIGIAQEILLEVLETLGLQNTGCNLNQKSFSFLGWQVNYFIIGSIGPFYNFYTQNTPNKNEINKQNNNFNEEYLLKFTNSPFFNNNNQVSQSKSIGKCNQLYSIETQLLEQDESTAGGRYLGRIAEFPFIKILFLSIKVASNFVETKKIATIVEMKPIFVSHSQQKMIFDGVGWNKLGVKNLNMYQKQYIELQYLNSNKYKLRSNKQNIFIQQNNTPCNKSKQAYLFLDKNHIDRIKHPHNSPNINSIEHALEILKKRKQKLIPKNLTNIQQFIELEQQKMPQEQIQNCSSHYQKRLNEVYDLKEVKNFQDYFVLNLLSNQSQYQNAEQRNNCRNNYKIKSKYNKERRYFFVRVLLRLTTNHCQQNVIVQSNQKYHNN
ncbi:hypothetical protein ABPG72_005686 [Tetrahymena utriculariae]